MDPRKTPLVSLVVCTHNERQHLGDCIRSAHGLADEALVVEMSSKRLKR